MGYRTWLNVAPDGTIVSAVWRLGSDAPPGHPVPSPDPERDSELRKNGGANLYYDGDTIRARAQVRWIVSPPVAAVGETITLTLAGLPDHYRESVDVLVGQDRIALAHPYVLELGWENAARVAVRIADVPSLVQPTFINVQFVERRRAP